VVAKIQSDGLKPGQGSWTMLASDLKSRLSELWLRPTLTFTDTRPDGSDLTWVCACVEPDGALYYAYRVIRSQFLVLIGDRRLLVRAAVGKPLLGVGRNSRPWGLRLGPTP